MYNHETGFPMAYQENKVHNLKLAAKPIDELLSRLGPRLEGIGNN